MATKSRIGSVKKKVLLLAMGGLTLGLSGSSIRSYKIIGNVAKEWGKIKKESIERAIKDLYESGLIGLSLQKDGSWKMTLTKDGKMKVVYFDIDRVRIKKPKLWDGKWRVIIYDIPESKKSKRDALREWMRRLGFHRLQASVFVLPYECKDEFDFLVEFLSLRKFVRFVVADKIDNEYHLKKIFSI